MRTNWCFRAQYTDYGQGLELFITRGDYERDDTIAAVTKIEIGRHKDGDQAPPSPIAERDGREFLRAALNCAWELGLRPDGYADARESMAAKTKHLEDMRSIAFNAIGATKP